MRHVNAAVAQIWMLDSRENALDLRGSVSAGVHLDGDRVKIPIGDSAIGRIATDPFPRIVDDIAAAPDVPGHAWALREGLVAFVA